MRCFEMTSQALAVNYRQLVHRTFWFHQFFTSSTNCNYTCTVSFNIFNACFEPHCEMWYPLTCMNNSFNICFRTQFMSISMHVVVYLLNNPYHCTNILCKQYVHFIFTATVCPRTRFVYSNKSLSIITIILLYLQMLFTTWLAINCQKRYIFCKHQCLELLTLINTVTSGKPVWAISYRCWPGHVVKYYDAYNITVYHKHRDMNTLPVWLSNSYWG